MSKRKILIRALGLAGSFYGWAFRNIFRLIKKSDEHITAIEKKKEENLQAKRR